MSGPLLAIDIGGTKCEAAIVLPDGALVGRHRIETPTTHDPELLLSALLDLIRRVRLEAPDLVPVACGVGCGGPMAQGGVTVSPLNIPAWRTYPLAGRLTAELGLSVTVENDAKALALGEGWLGAAQGQQNYLAMVVSTGIGGGIVLDGRLLDGRMGNAGHIGHVVVEPEGRACVCGGRGCLEAEASGTAVAAMTGRPASEAPLEVIERTGRLVGRGVASVATLLDLDSALVAGSVALGFGDPFFEAAQREIAMRCGLEFCAHTTVRPAGLGDRGPLLGAAAVAMRASGKEGKVG